MRIPARPIQAGTARGQVLASATPLSLLGGIDREEGEILDGLTGLEGELVQGRILVFPRGKGSTAGSYVLYGLKALGRAPAGLVAGEAESVIATGAILSEIPAVDRVQVDLFRTGDNATVNATEGYVELEDIPRRDVVTSFLRHKGRILLLRRSAEVGSFQGHWAAVSGYLEGEEPPLDRARVEILEETGWKDAALEATGEVVLARGREPGVIWAVHPFLFDISSDEITLDWEHDAYRWIAPEEMGQYQTVPKLGVVLRTVLPDLTRPV
jgi:predicted aconitase with swiveling domain/8-oxo-dGTP pyrophosphatase MutT (NUDIX family)